MRRNIEKKLDIVMNRFFKKNFHFVANRFEEWQSGYCTSKGNLKTNIWAETSNNSIHFELDDINELKMDTYSEFNFMESDILHDRIQYVKATSDLSPNIPIVCHLFVNDDTINCVRFAMTNPDRIIEFYGDLVELGQQIKLSSKIKSTNTKQISAEEIIQELESYNGLFTEALMERATKIYNAHSSVQSIDDAYSIIEALKLFVKANELDNNENSTSMFKPKILMFIALCNYTINNINTAYCIAKKALGIIDVVIDNSAFSGLSKSMFGGDTLEELIDTIETNYPENIEDNNYENVDENIIDTVEFECIIGKSLSKTTILNFINTLDSIRNQLMDAVILQENKKALFIIMELHEIASPVFYAWEYYGYGTITDFWKEDAAIKTYNDFSKNALAELRRMNNAYINGLFPLKAIDENDSLRLGLLNIITVLINEID